MILENLTIEQIAEKFDQPCWVMVNKDGRYWGKKRNTKNYKNAVIDTYYNFYEMLRSMYVGEWQYDRWKWNAIGIITYEAMLEAEKLRKESEESYSKYLNDRIGTIFVNEDHYVYKRVDDYFIPIWRDCSIEVINKENNKQ